MSTVQKGSTYVVMPKIAVIEAQTASALATAVQTQVNTLSKQLFTPASGQTAGNVINGSIVVTPAVISTNFNTGLPGSYICSVLWQEGVVPV